MGQSMENAESWRALFENWPESIPREGILVTTFGEQIVFTGFLISSGILLVERDKPDAVGARKVMVAYGAIAALKIASPMELARFRVMGFQSPF
jgi:hypothetical protein